jgi:hypothetical protein
MDKNTIPEMYAIWGKITVKAWFDKKFKDELLKNPKKILEEHGIKTERYKQINVIDKTKESSDTLNLTLYGAPSILSEADLAQLSGGQDECLY